MKKSVSFNEKMNEIIEYEKENSNYLEDYLETINKYCHIDKIKKEDYEYLILKNGKKIKKKVD